MPFSSHSNLRILSHSLIFSKIPKPAFAFPGFHLSMKFEQLIPGLPDQIARECLIRLSYSHFHTTRVVCKTWKDEIESDGFHHQRKITGSTRPVLVLAQAEPSRSLGAVKSPSTPVYRLVTLEPGSGSWNQLPPVPDSPDGLPLFCEIAGAGRELVLLGGWNPATWDATNDVYVYDFVSATWRRGARMPGPRRSFFSCGSDGNSRIFVAGGHDEDKTALRSAMAYDVARNEWAPLPDMARGRDECKGIFRRGSFHVIGGYGTDRQGRFERSAEGFDLATWRWGPVEDVLEIGTCPRTCVAGERGEVYRCRAGELVVSEGGTWRVMSQLPIDARVGPYVVMWQGKLLVIGAERHGGPYVAYMLESADEKKYTWTVVEAPKEYVGHVQAGCCLEV